MSSLVDRLFTVEDRTLKPGPRWTEAVALARQAEVRGGGAVTLTDLGRLASHASFLLCGRQLVAGAGAFMDEIEPPTTPAERERFMIAVGDASRVIDLYRIGGDE